MEAASRLRLGSPLINLVIFNAKEPPRLRTFLKDERTDLAELLLPPLVLGLAPKPLGHVPEAHVHALRRVDEQVELLPFLLHPLHLVLHHAHQMVHLIVVALHPLRITRMNH